MDCDGFNELLSYWSLCFVLNLCYFFNGTWYMDPNLDGLVLWNFRLLGFFPLELGLNFGSTFLILIIGWDLSPHIINFSNGCSLNWLSTLHNFYNTMKFSWNLYNNNQISIKFRYSKISLEIYKEYPLDDKVTRINFEFLPRICKISV